MPRPNLPFLLLKTYNTTNVAGVAPNPNNKSINTTNVAAF